MQVKLRPGENVLAVTVNCGGPRDKHVAGLGHEYRYRASNVRSTISNRVSGYMVNSLRSNHGVLQ